MRRAEWRRRADDPTTQLGWWWRGVLGRWPFVLCNALFAGCLFSAFVLKSKDLMFASALVLVLLSKVPVFSRPPRFDLLSPMLPDPPPPGQFRARVEYRREGLTTGRDDVALTVVEGWLIGEGVRSDFALRWTDVKSPITWTRRQKRLVLHDGSEIVIREMSDDFEGRATLRQWLRAKEPVEGEPTFPPREVHPQELARLAAWVMATPLTLAWMPVSRLLTGSPEARVASLFAMLVLLIAGTVWNFGRFWCLIKISDEANEATSLEAHGEQVPALVGNAERSTGP